MRAKATNAGTAQWQVDTDNVVFSDDTWTHVALVQNGTLPVLYIDGIAVAQTVSTTTDTTIWFNDLTGLDNGRIGDRNVDNGGETNHFNGIVDKVKIYNRELSANEIKREFSSSNKNSFKTESLYATSINASGNITSENVFLPQYIFSHTNETIPVLAANEWTNVTFGEDEAHIKLGIDHHHDSSINDTFEIHEDGIYDISYGLTLIDTSAGATDIDMAGRMVYINNTELGGSVFQTDIIRQEIETIITHRFLARLVTGDEIKLQFIASDSDVQLSDHSIFGDDPESALIVINKIANLL